MAKMTKERKNLSIGLLVFTAVIIATAVMGIILLQPSTEYIEGEADVEEYRVSSKVPARLGFSLRKATPCTQATHS